MPLVFEREEFSKSAPLLVDWLLAVVTERPEVRRMPASSIDREVVQGGGLSMRVRERLAAALVRLSGMGALTAGGCLDLNNVQKLHGMLCR